MFTADDAGAGWILVVEGLGMQAVLAPGVVRVGRKRRRQAQGSQWQEGVTESGGQSSGFLIII